MGKRGPKKRKSDVDSLNLSKSQDRDKKRDDRAKEDPVATYLRIQADIVRQHKKHQQELAAEKEAKRKSRRAESTAKKGIRLEGQKKRQSDARDSESDATTTVRKSKDKARKCIERQLAETRLKRAQVDTDERPATPESDHLESPSLLERRLTDDDVSASQFELDPDSLTREFFEDAANDFQARLWSIQNVRCPNCKERFPDIKLNTKTGFCGKCTKNKDKYTTRNNMDPGIQPEELTGLTTIESILISRIVPSMSVYRLPHGQYGYSGNVINIPQDVESIATVLPRILTDVNILVLRKTGQSGTCKDFKVRRARVYAALKWLCRHNIYYDDVNISDEHLSMLPDDGELTFPSIVEDETDPNNKQFDDDSASESDYDLAELLDSFEDCPADDPRDDLADGYLRH